MEKKKSKLNVFGIKLKDFVQHGTIVGGCIWGIHWLDEKFVKIDGRFDAIEVEVKKTSGLLDTYLMWRFVYPNDTIRKNMITVSDPKTRTLMFVEKTTAIR